MLSLLLRGARASRSLRWMLVWLRRLFTVFGWVEADPAATAAAYLNARKEMINHKKELEELANVACELGSEGNFVVQNCSLYNIAFHAPLDVA